MNNTRERPPPSRSADRRGGPAGGDQGQPPAEEEAETLPGTSGQAVHRTSPESSQHRLPLEPPSQSAHPGLRPVPCPSPPTGLDG